MSADAPRRDTVLIAVTHLLGIGHFARMVALARALTEAGMAVTLVSGGRPVPTLPIHGIRLVQLPPIHCRGTDFRTLLADDGLPAGDAVLNARRAMLVDAVAQTRPAVVISELYPFGRRALAAEFEALLAAAHALVPRPAILASIRDVLNPPGKPGRAAEALERLARDFDAVLVHGDAATIPLDVSWPVDQALARRLAYTGYLHDGTGREFEPAAAGRAGIVVSAGGSEAGEALCIAAAGAARMLADQTWRILAGHGVPDDRFAAIAAAAPANAIVERARPDFRALLAGAALSVSQAGYNTVLDLAEARPRAVLVPFAAGGEREQTIRAEALAARGLATILPENALDAQSLALTINQALAGPAPDWSGIRRDGATRSVALVSHFAARARARHQAWQRLAAALQLARQAGTTIPFWIRDDDARAPGPALERFLALLAKHAIPAGFAAIPGGAQASLATCLHAAGDHDLLVHGLTHTNHAPGGEKAAEFGAHRRAAAMAADMAEGLARLREAAGGKCLPVFVPPWNRLSSEAAEALGRLGYRGLSTFGSRSRSTAPPELIVANTHWDPIAWRAGGGLKDEAELIDSLAALITAWLAAPAEDREVIGLLTHHLVHDGWIERFLDELLRQLAASGCVRFLPAREVFGLGGRAG